MHAHIHTQTQNPVCTLRRGFRRHLKHQWVAKGKQNKLVKWDGLFSLWFTWAPIKKSHPGSGTFYWFNECVPKYDELCSLPKTEGKSRGADLSFKARWLIVFASGIRWIQGSASDGWTPTLGQNTERWFPPGGCRSATIPDAHEEKPNWSESQNHLLLKQSEDL